jgi:uncharacterized protein (DUF885 family)
VNPAFNEFMECICLAIAREVPEFPTQMGVFEIAGEAIPQDYFTAIDSGSVARRQQLLSSIEEGLDEFSPRELDESEQLSANVLRYFVKHVHERGLTGLAGKDFLQHEYLIRPSVGIQSELPLFLTDLHPMRHAGDAEDYLSRLKSIASQLIEANQQIQQRQQGGLIPPAIVLQGVIAEIEEFTAIEAGQNILYRALSEKSANLPDLTGTDRQLLLSDAKAELLKHTYPAYQELLATLRIQAAQARHEPGVWTLPEGEAWYEFLLGSATTTRLSAAEIHELGLQEVDRLEQEIIQACRALGIDAKRINDCHRELDKRKSETREDTAQNRRTIVSQIEATIADIEPKLSRLFHHLPKGRVTVKPIPRFAEAHRNQSYQPPSVDGSRDGFLELNTGQLLGEADYELPILVYHEVFPGHHLQISLAQENEALPTMRRITTFDAYIEGWAKYAETIPVVYGMNQDPMLNLARMRRELISTINLALDTGVHSKRWNESQAVTFFKDHSGMSDSFARYIVHRSASAPAQLCSYKIGMMKMQELRQRMELALGQEFDVRDFHHSVLSRGALPLDLLDATVNQDIARLRREETINL